MSMDYFGAFGLERSFNIDLNKLERVYLELQLLCHPDKFINSDSAGKAIALEKSILINKAYGVLRADVDRALHLLELAGVELDSENLIDSPQLLSEAFTEREELDAASSLEQFESLLHETSEKLKQYKEEFNIAYEAHEWNGASIAYKKMLYKNKFAFNIKQRIKQFREEKCS